MDDETLDERQKRIVIRLQNKYQPEPGSITLDPKTRREIRWKLISITALFIVMGAITTTTFVYSLDDRLEYKRELTLKNAEITRMEQQISSLQRQLNTKEASLKAQYEDQLKVLELKWRQTEDRRYQAQRTLNRKTEVNQRLVAENERLKGNTAEAQLMLDKMKDLLNR